MQVARKIAYNVLTSSVSKILSTALALVSIGLITRYLGKEGFGNYATVLAYLALFSAIADLGLYSVATREISRPDAKESAIMGNIFTLRLAISLFVAFLSPVIVIFLPYPAEVKSAIMIVAVSFLFSSAYQVLNGIFQKNLAMDKVAFAELMGKFIQVGMIYVAIKFDLGFLWIISSLLFFMIFNFLVIFLWSKKYLRFKLKIDLAYWKKFLRESYPIGIAAFITFVYFKIDTILLSILKSSADVGIYGAAYKVVENITFFPAMIIGLIFPIMSRNIFSDRARFVDVSNKVYKVFWLIVTPLVIGALFFSDEIMRYIGGGEFSQSAGVLRILIFALAFIFFGNFFNAILISAGKQKKMMIIMAIAAVFNVCVNLIFIGRYSYHAAAFVSVATELLVSFGGGYMVYREIKYVPNAGKFFAIIGAGILMAIFIYFLRGFDFFILGPMSVAAYLAALWLLRAVRTEEILSIVSRKASIQEVSPDIDIK